MSDPILKKYSISAAVAMALAVPVDAYAATDVFLKIPGVEGESKDAAHKNEIDVLQWSWGMTQGDASAPGGAKPMAGPCVNDVSITKLHDAASPDLYQALSNGTTFPKVTLTVRKAGDKPLEYIVIEFSDVLVTSVATGGTAGEDVPAETLSLNFTKVEGSYTPQEDDGSAGDPEHWVVTPGKCQ